jgi:hypothetical protein
VRVDVEEFLGSADALLLWDVIMKWKPKTRFPLLIQKRTSDDAEVWLRSRHDISDLLDEDGMPILDEDGETLLTE